MAKHSDSNQKLVGKSMKTPCYVTKKVPIICRRQSQDIKIKFDKISKQDGRLAPAYFSPNYKYFDQLLQTVINTTTVLILVFTNISSTTDFCTLCKRVSRFSVEKFSSHSAEKIRRGIL